MRDVKDVARYIGLSMIQKGLSVSPLKLQKLLYYVQAWYMVFFKKKNLFPDAPQAWVNGPVYPSVYQTYKSKVRDMCGHLDMTHFGVNAEGELEDAIRELANNMQLSSEEVKLIDKILILYGSKSQTQLVFLSHSEKPWAETRGELPPYERSTKEIPLAMIYDYYYDRWKRNHPDNA